MNALDPTGAGASAIADLWWLMFSIGTVAFVVVTGLVLYALWRGRRAGENERPEPRHARNLVIWGGIVVPAVILFVVLVASLQTSRRLVTLGNADPSNALTIEITGRQFWWDVRYRDESPHLEFRTANEIHVPTGRPVNLRLRSSDVIHSFWIPNVHGKMDLVPGQENSIWIEAEEEGIFEGQCAEFCGLAHAQMRIILVAQEPEDFDTWRTEQLRRQDRPEDPELARGFDVFMSNGCAFCHAVRGTLAGGRVGPDLTHFGSRRTIAAGLLPNTRGHLAGWIADPQALKPGNLMPAIPLEGESLQALLTYMESLH